MTSARKSVFISCAQFSEEERALGKQVATLVDECTLFRGYFAENQTILETFTENVLRRLYESVGSQMVRSDAKALASRVLVVAGCGFRG
jgi:hypothetical protein